MPFVWVLVVILASPHPFLAFRSLEYLLEGAAIEILKLQETSKLFTGAYDQIMFSSKTSGWTVCKEYAASFWVKKVSWSAACDIFLRISSNPS